MPEHRVRKVRGRRERLVVVAEGVAEEVVHRREHLRARAVVARQREQARRLRAALAEDLEVGMPEPVDRLELVTDREHLGQLRMRHELHELALEPIRVLELVDHDRAEAELYLLANRLVGSEQVARRELEILEVDHGLAPLRGRVLGGEALEKLLQERAIGGGELLESSPLRGLPRLLERGRPRAPAGERREIDETLGRRARVERADGLGRVSSLCGRRRLVGCQPSRLGAKRGRGLREARPLAELEHELAPRGAKRLEDAREHAPQPVGAVRGQETHALGLAGRAEPLERAVERLAAQDRRSRLLELAEPRIEAGRERIRAQEPLQKPWIVEIHAPSSPRARSGRPRSRSAARMRPRSSPAALRV